jgi:hypothetical protein
MEFRELSSDDSKVKYLFHGNRTPESFMGDGFDENRERMDPGWYGVGFYLTSFLDYALCYQYQKMTFSSSSILDEISTLIQNDGGSFKILLMLCNLGNCQRINRKQTGRKLKSGVDSHYIVVQRGLPVPNQPLADYPIFDEFVLKDKHAICPQFIVTFRLRKALKLLVWRNTSFERYHNDSIFANLKRQFPEVTMMAYDCDADAHHRIRKTKDKTQLFVISNRADDGAQFLAKCREAEVTTPMLVFCLYVVDWIPMDDVKITKSTSDVFEFVENVVMAN